MKRALAERAKQTAEQSSPPHGSPNHTTTNATTPSTDEPPHKAPRLESPVAARKTVLRTYAVEDNDQDSFYLKHQNRALATELQSLQTVCQELEAEREVRRQHCRSAVQALNSLQATWTQLETALGQSMVNSSTAPTNSSSSSSATLPPSTGSHQAVEWTRALASALAALGSSSSATATTEKDWQVVYTDLTHLSANVATRAQTLQEHVRRLLQGHTTATVPTDTTSTTTTELSTKCLFLAQQVEELALVRDSVTAKERRLRRNLFRLAAGMLTVEQVLKTLDSAQENQELQAAVKLEATTNSAVKREEEEEETREATATVSSKDVEKYQTKIANLEKMLSNREETIESLNDTVKDKELAINELAVKQQSEEDVAKLKDFESTRLKLEHAEKMVEKLQGKLNDAKEHWAQARGNEQALQAALEEQVEKFEKRWLEFINSLSEEQERTTEPENNDEGLSLARHMSQAKEIVELRHKLDQAIENVRQAESTRAQLADALEMNQQIQSELETVKNKYSALQQANRKEAADAANQAAAKEKESTAANDKVPSTGENNSKFEKMHRDYRRARKDLAAMTASKEAAKAKLERSEKERESLMETNARLLRQSAEKDEMNAKSLATILHLKSLTDQLTLERENLEQQVKSANQLALSARLATNSKDRVSEEVLKEKESIQERLRALQQEHEQTKGQLEKVTQELSEASGQSSNTASQLANALKRSGELVTENQNKAEEIRKLVDSVDRYEREAQQANAKLDTVLKSSGGVAAGASAFTVDQLNTQISVLKGRLACPVCHYRDKECIIMRCRHMHCKQCVDERVSNRSRKCPTCNVKFSEKDIADIWLN